MSDFYLVLCEKNQLYQGLGEEQAVNRVYLNPRRRITPGNPQTVTREEAEANGLLISYPPSRRSSPSDMIASQLEQSFRGASPQVQHRPFDWPRARLVNDENDPKIELLKWPSPSSSSKQTPVARDRDQERERQTANNRQGKDREGSKVGRRAVGRQKH